jgi:pimeloyl-ACP methyl ester carboxylesterase
MWDDQARELKRAYRVLRYDQRGHGGTEGTAGRYSFELLLADVIALMDALGIKKAHFAGLSMGGATALGLAAETSGPASTASSSAIRRASRRRPARSNGRALRHCRKAGHGAAGRAHRRALVSAGRCSRPIRRISTRSADGPHHPGEGFIGCARRLANTTMPPRSRR